MPEQWAADWDDDGDESDSELAPPEYYNADAELARELDLSRVWEPTTLKFVETPFTIANRRRRESEEKAAAGKAKGKPSAAGPGRAVTACAGDNQYAGPSGSSAPVKQDDPPPARRRGPVPAKSGKLFGVDPVEEKKEAAKKAPLKWTKAEVDGWKDAAGNPIPSTKPAGGKKAAAGRAKKSIVEMMAESAETVKGGKGSKINKGAEVKVQAAGAGVELPDEPEVAVKKKRAPARKKKNAEDGEAEPVVKRKAAPKKKVKIAEAEGEGEEEMGRGGAERDREVIVVDSDEGVLGEQAASDDETDSLAGIMAGRKRAKERSGVDKDDPATKKAKPAPKPEKAPAPVKGKGKGKAKEADDAIRFSRLPAGAGPSDDYPIIQLLEHQKTLPTKPKSKPAAKAKPKATKATTKKAKKPPPKSSSLINDDDANDIINDLTGVPAVKTFTVEDLIPALNPSRSLKRKQESEGGESVDPEGSDGDVEDRVQLGEADEEEGKQGLMSRYFAQAGGGGRTDGGDSDAGRTAPTTLVGSSQFYDPPTITKLAQDESELPEASSVLPYSSPAEKKALRRQDSNLVHPQPVRSIPLPNAAKFDQLARIAERSKKEAEKKKPRKDEPDVSSYMKNGLTIAHSPMSVKGPYRRSPQPQIDGRFRGAAPELRPAKPNVVSADMFRSPAHKVRKVDDDAAADEKPTWGTLGAKGKKITYTPYDYHPSAPTYTSSLDPSSAQTVGQLSKRAKLFTPTSCPPPPEITIPTPKFRTKTSAGVGQYGSEASSRTEEAVLDPYKRAEMEYGRKAYGQVFADSPEVEILRGRTGQVYTIPKEPKGGRNGERPRYMPALAAVGTEEQVEAEEGSGDWRNEWKFQPKNEGRVETDEEWAAKRDRRQSAFTAIRAPAPTCDRPSSSFVRPARVAFDTHAPFLKHERPASAFGRPERLNPLPRPPSSGYHRPPSSLGQQGRSYPSATQISSLEYDRPSSFERQSHPYPLATQQSSSNHDLSYSSLGRVDGNGPSEGLPRADQRYAERQIAAVPIIRTMSADSATRNYSAPIRSSFPPTNPSHTEHPAYHSYHDRSASRETSRDPKPVLRGTSRLANIPMATFSGSRSRPATTTNNGSGLLRGSSGRNERNENDWGGMAGDGGQWWDTPEAGLSRGRGGYGGAVEWEGGSYKAPSRAGFRSAGETSWEGSRA